MEEIIDSYFLKLSEIGTLCNNHLTTKDQLETEINNLENIDITLDTSFAAQITTPTDFQLFRKCVLVDIERNMKMTLQNALLNLLELKKINAFDIEENEVMEIYTDYQNESALIKEYVKEIFEYCTCMSNRKNIADKLHLLN